MSKNNIEEVTLEYFGEDSPAVYGINFRRFSENEYIRPYGKVYAVSAHYLGHAQWSGDYKPIAKAGYSIFIYDFRKGEHNAQELRP